MQRFDEVSQRGITVILLLSICESNIIYLFQYVSFGLSTSFTGQI
jgi:hypothetical protein